MRNAARLAWIPLVVVLIAFVGFVIVTATGHRTLVVMSDSMAPTLSAGDVVIVKTINPGQVNVGDIVTFRDPTREKQLVTHRAILVQPTAGSVAFVTKGDQNSGVEEWTVGQYGTIGRLSLRIPLLGRALAWLGTPGVRALMICAALLLLGAAAIRYGLQLRADTLYRPAMLLVAACLGLVLGSGVITATFAALASASSNTSNTFQAAASFCTPGTQTVYATADAWVDEAAVGTNNGTGVELAVKSGVPKNRRTLVRFSLPSLGSCSLTGATLQLYAVTSATPRTIEVSKLDAAWVENTVTWTTQPTASGATSTAPAGNGWRSWNVTPQVASMYAGPDHGFLIKDQSEGSGPLEQIFASRETAFRPALTVTYG